MQKPSFNTSTTFKDVARLLMLKSRLYIGLGSLTDDEIPTTKEEMQTLITGESAKCVPIGSLDEGSGQVKWSQKTIKYDEGEFPSNDFDISGELKSVYLDEEAITAYESDDFKQEMTLVVAPTNTDDVFLAFSGILFTSEGEINLNKDKSTVNLKFKANTGKISQCIKLKRKLT